jgi:hypothetical protein
MKTDFQRIMLVPLKIWRNGIGWIFKRMKIELRAPSFKVTRNFLLIFQHASRIFRRESTVKVSSLDAIMAFYDLTVAPVTFDFAYFLADADSYARSKGKAGIYVYIIESDNDIMLSDKNYNQIIDKSKREWRIQNILLPLISHYPSCIGFAVVPRAMIHDLPLPSANTYPPMYNLNYHPPFRYREAIKNITNRGFSGFMATNQGKKYVEGWCTSHGINNKKLVAITLRRYGYEVERNSDIDAWCQFAQWVRGLGYCPVFIPDTDSCWECLPQLEGEIIFSEAAWNIGLRIAMNEVAIVNFFVSNGTAAIAQLSKQARFVHFLPIIPNSQADAEIYIDYGLNVEKSEKFPFAMEDQLLSFTNDEFDHIKSAFLRVSKHERQEFYKK